MAISALPVATATYSLMAKPSKAYLIVVMTGESVRRWNVKKRLAFRRISQDGDDEECLHLDRLPTAHEADLIRGANVICDRKH